MPWSYEIVNLAETLARIAALEAGAARFGMLRAVVGSELNYAGFISSGTRPHDIVPRNAQVLAWASQGTPTRLTGKPTVGAVRSLGSGAFTFSMHVHHPGTKPNPYVEEAAAAVGIALTLHVSEAIDKISAGGPDTLLGETLNASGLELMGAIMERAPVKTGTLRRSWHTEVAEL